MGVHGEERYKNMASNSPDWLRYNGWEEHNLYTTLFLPVLGGHHKPTFRMVKINQCELKFQICPMAVSKTSENERWGNYTWFHHKPKNSPRYILPICAYRKMSEHSLRILKPKAPIFTFSSMPPLVHYHKITDQSWWDLDCCKCVYFFLQGYHSSISENVHIFTVGL